MGNGTVAPVPVSAILLGLPPALSVMVKLPLRAPATVGLNVTKIVQFAAAGTDPPLVQVPPDLAKSPLITIVDKASAALPVLLTVTVCAALVVLICTLPKLKLAGSGPTTGDKAATPLPARAMACGLPVALLVMVIAPVLLATVAGVNVTLIVQLNPVPRLAPQLLFCANSPDAVILLKVSVALPELVSVTVFAALVTLIGWLPNARLVGVRLTCGVATAMPVPLNAILAAGAFDVIATDPVRAPTADGVNVTAIVQVAFAATVPPLTHVPDLEKSTALVPPTVMVVSVRFAVPVFFSVTVCAGLAEPTVTLPKARPVLGVSVIAGAAAATPVPESDTACGLPAALSDTEIDPVFAPSVVGLKLTLILQLRPAPRLAPQAFVCVKSAEEEAIPPIVSAPVPVFFSVITCVALVLLIC